MCHLFTNFMEKMRPDDLLAQAQLDSQHGLHHRWVGEPFIIFCVAWHVTNGSQRATEVTPELDGSVVPSHAFLGRPWKTCVSQRAPTDLPGLKRPGQKRRRPLRHSSLKLETPRGFNRRAATKGMRENPWVSHDALDFFLEHGAQVLRCSLRHEPRWR